MFVMGTIASGNLLLLVGSIFLPMIVIPGTLIILLFSNPVSAILQIGWLVLGFALISSE